MTLLPSLFFSQSLTSSREGGSPLPSYSSEDTTVKISLDRDGVGSMTASSKRSSM